MEEAARCEKCIHYHENGWGVGFCRLWYELVEKDDVCSYVEEDDPQV